MGFPGSSAGKESACSAGDLGSIPGSRRSPGERNGLIKRFFSSSSFFAIRMVPSAYLGLLIFLLAACGSSSLVFHMMYSAYKLNKQDDSIQP